MGEEVGGVGDLAAKDPGIPSGAEGEGMGGWGVVEAGEGGAEMHNLVRVGVGWARVT